MSAPASLATSLDRLAVGPPQSRHNLHLLPLLREDQPLPPVYVTLRDGMASGRVRISEVSEYGSVPVLLVVNDLDRPVLILDGEQLVGAKQNRIANLSILVPPATKLEIPVSCVEHGRWNYSRADFAADPDPLFAQLRASKVARVSCAMAAHAGRAADQGEIWSEIAAKAERLQVRSRTGAMKDVYEQHRRSVEDFADAFPALPGQAGAVFAIDGEVRGMDLFDSPSTLRAALPTLVRSYALDAIDRGARHRGGDAGAVPLAGAPVAFLDEIRGADARVYDGLGLGQDVRFETPAIAGGALVLEDEVIHLCAFRRSGGNAARKGWHGRVR